VTRYRKWFTVPASQTERDGSLSDVLSATSTSLREQTLERVRSAIVSGRSRPGLIYSVPALATTLGVSSTPVREALLELSQHGLLTPLRNRGFQVTAPSLQELRNLFDVRVVLETYALVTIAKQGLTETAPLRALANDIAETVAQGDAASYVETDRHFHQALVARAGNPLLTATVIGLRDNMRLYGIDSPSGVERQRASVGEHFRLIDLAASGEADAIPELMQLHIRAWEPVFVDGLLAQQANQG
jgi:DNA-binding GntR family transcriptional regulator